MKAILFPRYSTLITLSSLPRQPITGATMNIHPDKASIWQDAGFCEEVARQRHSSASGTTKYILFSVFGTIFSIVIPILLVIAGVGMSAQSERVALNGATASLLATILGFFVIRRLLGFPLLRSHGYIALTFAMNFSIVAITLRFFRIDFSSPQFFLGMVIITALVEMFFYAQRQWAPSRIAVIPGATNVLLPEQLTGAVEFRMLTSV